ncbi:MAG: hypothetical protein SOI66_09075 [Bifidobacterium sp.]|jgi:hypothetical protein
MASAKPQETPEPNDIAEEEPKDAAVEEETASAVEDVTANSTAEAIDVGPGRTETYEATRPDGMRLRITRNLDTGRQHTDEV